MHHFVSLILDLLSSFVPWVQSRESLSAVGDSPMDRRARWIASALLVTVLVGMTVAWFFFRR